MDFDVRLGLRNVWGGVQPFGIDRVDRRRHLYTIGQTGTGKSTLMREMIAQDIAAGEGIALIDPHGDLAFEVLDRIPPHRTNDVVVIDPSDKEFVVGFNPFFHVEKDERPLVASNVVMAMKHIWADMWGPRLERILLQTVYAILDSPDHLRPSILSILRVFSDLEYRKQISHHIENPEAKRFFEEIFEKWNDRQEVEYLESSDNKISQFVANPFIRNILGTWKPALDINRIVEDRKILIVRLSKGLLGEEPANLLGSLVVSGIQQAVMRRSDRPEAERADFSLYIDEFHNFTTDAFASILSEARKYGLSLIVAHQYLDQLSDEVRDAVFGNVGSIVSFRVSAGDAERLAGELGKYQPDTFRDLNRGQICTRIVVDGMAGETFIGNTEPEITTVYQGADTVIARSRRHHATPRAEVERRIQQWEAR